MSEPVSISTGIAGRYATAIFELARDEGAIDALSRDLDALSDALAESADFNALIQSPIYSRQEQSNAVGAIAERMGLSGVLSNALRLMASNRRLFVLPQLLSALRARVAEHRGEMTAEVTSSRPLTADQSERLARTLAARMGKHVSIKATVDESLIGGLIVKVGSKMIDTSIRSKLASLQNAMKEVG